MSFKHRYAKRYLLNSIQKRCDLAPPIYQTLGLQRSLSLSNRQATTCGMSSIAQGVAEVYRDLERLHG